MKSLALSLVALFCVAAKPCDRSQDNSDLISVKKAPVVQTTTTTTTTVSTPVPKKAVDPKNCGKAHSSCEK